MRFPLATAAALFFLILHAPAQFPGTTWERLSDAEAADAGWSREKLASAHEYAATLDTEAVMIVTHGKVLDAWGPIDQKFNIHSIRKSFLSALYGIQVSGGRLKLQATMQDLGIDDNPPSLSDVEKRATVLQLLQARSGIYHEALYESQKMKDRRPERYSHEPGTFWYYNNWDFNALGTIYEKVTTHSIFDDFENLVTRKLRLEDYHSLEDGTYVTGPASVHRAYPFRMTARDMARFGLLYLHGGQWRSAQIIPANWVRDSLTTWSDAGSSGGYGYMWWVSKNGLHFPGVMLPAGSFSARGSGGHFILVIPSLDLVIVHRVNTDIEGRRVESAQFGELVHRILSAYRPPPVAGGTPRALDTLLPLLMSKYRVPGVGVVGIEGRMIAWERYFGVREVGKNALVDQDTIFEAASMTKPLAAYAALKLVEQGRLKLDQPLVSYLAEPYLKDQPLHEKITARMVLTHTSGFPNWRPKGEPLKVLHKPGTVYGYSGEGLQFLQTVMEKITGEDYETYMQRTLLGPLGMKRSSHVWQPQFAEDSASGHDEAGKVKAGRKFYTKPNAAYTLYTTPRDYAAFVLEMMTPDRSAAHSLSAKSIQAMLTPASPPADRELLERRGSQGSGFIRFGLGWSVEPTASGDRIRHAGSNGTGFRSYVEFDPAATHGIVIMTNADNGDEFWKELMSYIGKP